MMEGLRLLLPVLMVLGLALALRWWLGRGGRFGRGRANGAVGRLEPLGRLPLSPQHTLHLVRVGDRALLIGSHPGGCSLLESLSWESLEGARGGQQA